jgi:hypothetical protein
MAPQDASNDDQQDAERNHERWSFARFLSNVAGEGGVLRLASRLQREGS